MAKRIRPSDLPTLTETVDSTTLDLPTLTEEVITTLSPKQCRQLAERLFPELEATLLNAISSTPEANWETAMQQIKVALPKLIRKAAQDSL